MALKTLRGDISLDEEIYQLADELQQQFGAQLGISEKAFQNRLLLLKQNAIDISRTFPTLITLTTDQSQKLDKVARQTGFKIETIKDLVLLGTKEVWQYTTNYHNYRYHRRQHWHHRHQHWHHRHQHWRHRHQHWRNHQRYCRPAH